MKASGGWGRNNNNRKPKLDFSLHQVEVRPRGPGGRLDWGVFFFVFLRSPSPVECELELAAVT